MKAAFFSLLAAASTASAHYTFPELVVGSTHTGQWNYVRKTTNYQSNGEYFQKLISTIECNTYLHIHH